MMTLSPSYVAVLRYLKATGQEINEAHEWHGCPERGLDVQVTADHQVQVSWETQPVIPATRDLEGWFLWRMDVLTKEAQNSHA